MVNSQQNAGGASRVIDFNFFFRNSNFFKISKGGENAHTDLKSYYRCPLQQQEARSVSRHLHLPQDLNNSQQGPASIPVLAPFSPQKETTTETQFHILESFLTLLMKHKSPQGVMYFIFFKEAAWFSERQWRKSVQILVPAPSHLH